MEQTKAFFKIIDELCEEKNINQKYLSYGWIRELRKGEKSHYVMRYQFDLNSAISFNIASDKFATYEVLKSNNVPTIEHKMIFNPETRSHYYEKKFINQTKELLKKNNNKIVIKANNSSQGKDVYYCSSEEEIEKVVSQLFLEKNDTLSACPFLNIDFEYRVVYLSEEVLFIYKKRKPFVTGDGEKTLQELIDIKKELYPNITLIKDLDLNYIPKVGEEIIVSWKHNLSGGAVPILLENDEYEEKVKQVALEAGKALNIEFATIDVAVTDKKEVLVMEINSSVCMNKFAEIIPEGYKIAKDIYSKAIDKMFD